MSVFNNAKKLGFGLMRLPLTDPSNEATIDMEQSKKMVDLYMEKGFTYFDTAWMYHEFKSEEAVKEILVDRYPRESFTLATKMHDMCFNSYEDLDKTLNQQLANCGVDYFDYYLLHDIGKDNIGKFEDCGCFDWIKEKKEQGILKHIGFSSHDHADFLDEILEDYPEMEFVQLQINYLDWLSEGIQAKAAYEAVRSHGVDVVVMEPVKGGTLVNLPEEVRAMFKEREPELSEASWAIRFAAGLPGVEMVLSGMSNLAQMEDNLSYMSDLVPLTEEEQDMLQDAVAQINAGIAIPCTACSYCTSGCPMNIPIPRYFSLYNMDLQDVEAKGWKSQEEYYVRTAEEFGKASDCIRCGACEGICPQHLPIIQHLSEVAGHFE